MDPVFFLLPKDDENRALKPGAGYQNRFLTASTGRIQRC